MKLIRWREEIESEEIIGRVVPGKLVREEEACLETDTGIQNARVLIFLL